MSTKQIDGYKIRMNEVLGRGSFGDVFVGVSDETQAKVAIKVLKKANIDSDEYLKNALFNEIKIMQTVLSENIVGLIDVMESNKNYYIVQELCDGDLSSIVKPGKPLPEQEARGYLLQICNGFLALVREGIIHRDLKPANIMRKGHQLKIGDFGFAKKIEGKEAMKSIVGTPLYMSLQILKGKSYSSKCDIWALGFIYYEMLHGYTPWTAKSEFQLVKNIESKPLEISKQISSESADFIKHCLAINETQRISWDELFVHPIFNGYFLHQSQGNTQFENKLKMVMSDLRFEINSHNLDLLKILTGLGYKSGEVELDHDSFFEFLKIVSSTVTRRESDYIFAQTDLDGNGTISIQEIEQMMAAHNISLQSINPRIPGIKRQDTSDSMSEEGGFVMSEATEEKIRSCFTKLMRILQKQNRLLYDVFMKFDKEKVGSLDRTEFRKMLKQLSQELDNDEIDSAFDLIDADHSNSIEFEELNNYFSKVNGIPPNLNQPQNQGQQNPNFFQQMFSPSQQQFPIYQQPPYQQSGFNNHGGGYFQQPNPYFQQGPQQMYGQPNPYVQQQPGLFGNPILDQLTQNMMGNSQQSQQQQQGWGKW